MFALFVAAIAVGLAPQADNGAFPGKLRVLYKDGSVGASCPLEATQVEAFVSGFGVRVNVTQTFKNTSSTPIEAVYTFPLSDTGAVDRMRMDVGGRVIEGQIKPRDEARQIYEAAKAQGQMAGLLDQERPNIFTQSVANILPNARIKVEISYVELMRYENGQFEFSFPMTVAPRYLGNTPDPNKISPPITPKGTHTGSAIHLTVHLDAGAPIEGVESVLHKVVIGRPDPTRADVSLAKDDEVANRDFILRYRTATSSIQTAFVTQMDPGGKGGFFTLVMTPPAAPRPEQIGPREVLFVLDTSGSQQGFPLAKGKELAHQLIRTLRPNDTFNVIKFNTQVTSVFGESQPLSETSLTAAGKFIDDMVAGGGTDVNAGLLKALDCPQDSTRTRMIVIETDGLIGNENVVLNSIQKHRGKTARIFTFGVGNSVNRYLIDAMSQEGKGDSEIVTLADRADAAVSRFLKRTQTPILTDVSAQFSGVAVQDVLPTQIPDVFNQKPIVLYGRFSSPGKGHVTLSGNLGTTPWTKTIDLNFGANRDATALPSLWARKKVSELTSEDYLNSLSGRTSVQSQITDVALEYGIMSYYTSFVAVEPTVVNVGGRMRTVRVPIEMADGVSYDMTVGSPNPQVGLQLGVPAGGAGFGGGGGFGGRGQVVAGASPGFFAKGSSGAAYPRIAGRDASASAEELVQLKVEKSLREAKSANVEVQIWLTDLSVATKQALQKAGFTIEGSSERLRILFGKCDASALRELAKLAQVQRVEPL